MWKTYNHKFCSWPSNDSRLYANCYEKDNNITTTVTDKISADLKFLGVFNLSQALSIQTKFQGADDDMGTYMILKSDASTGKYGNGNLELYFKH